MGFNHNIVIIYVNLLYESYGNYSRLNFLFDEICGGYGRWIRCRHHLHPTVITPISIK